MTMRQQQPRQHHQHDDVHVDDTTTTNDTNATFSDAFRDRKSPYFAKSNWQHGDPVRRLM